MIINTNFAGGGIKPLSIAIGTYTPDGTYGSANKNTLTFEFEPKILFVTCTSAPHCRMIVIRGANMANTNNDSMDAKVTVEWNGNSVSWYYARTSTSGAYYQMNAKDYTYSYAAIG